MRLFGAARPAVRRHYARLDERDLYFRFCTCPSAGTIDAYVEALDFSRHVVLGLYGEDLELAGVAHVADGPGGTELGISVLAECRRRGYATRLLRLACLHSRVLGASRMLLESKSENGALLALARSQGARVEHFGGDVEAVIELPPLTPATLLTCALLDGCGRADLELSARRHAWRAWSAAG